MLKHSQECNKSTHVSSNKNHKPSIHPSIHPTIRLITKPLFHMVSINAWYAILFLFSFFLFRFFESIYLFINIFNLFSAHISIPSTHMEGELIRSGDFKKINVQVSINSDLKKFVLKGICTYANNSNTDYMHQIQGTHIPLGYTFQKPHSPFNFYQKKSFLSF